MATIVRRKGSKNWYLVWYEGKCRRWKSLGTDNRRDAEDLAADIEAVRCGRKRREELEALVERLSRVDVKRQGIALADSWTRFEGLPSRRKVSERTQRSKQQHVEAWLAWMQKQHPEVETLREVSERVAMEYFGELQKRVASVTYNNNLSSVRSVVESLLSVSGGKNPFDHVPRAEVQAIRKEAFTVNEVKKLVKKAKGFGKVPGFWQLAIKLGFYTGLRLADVCNLAGENIDDERQAIRVATAKQHRRNQVLHLPIPDGLWRELRKVRTSPGPIWPDVAKAHQGNTGWLAEEWRALLKQVGLKANRAPEEDEHRQRKVVVYGFHSLRHAYVTAAMDAGAELGDVQLAAGHATRAMTGHYSHSLAPAQRVLARLPKV